MASTFVKNGYKSPVLLQNLIFRSDIFTIADADIGSLKTLHTLFDKYLDHMPVKFEQNRIVQTILKFVLF